MREHLLVEEGVALLEERVRLAAVESELDLCRAQLERFYRNPLVRVARRIKRILKG